MGIRLAAALFAVLAVGCGSITAPNDGGTGGTASGRAGSDAGGRGGAAGGGGQGGVITTGRGGTGGGCVSAPQATTCANRCGRVADNCGVTVDCGTVQCAAPNTCGGGDAPDMCGCKAIAIQQACGSNICGAASNGCGAAYSCGLCPNSRPKCCGTTCALLDALCP